MTGKRALLTVVLAGALGLSSQACSPFSTAQPPTTAPTPSFTAEITPTKDDSQRALVLQSVRNGRDLGGIAGKKGQIPLGRFIRTGSLSHATESDRTVLADHGVKLDIDLRTVWEVLRSPDRLSGDKRFHYLNVSLVGVGIWDAIYPSSRGQLYVRALAHHQAQFHRVFHAMAQQKEGVVLFHCAAGKDRTGMIAAILLDLAGVDRETIVHNYAISAKYLYPSAKGPEEEAAAISESPPEAIEMFLDALDKEYGGAEAYLKKIGLPASEIDALRDRLGQN